MTSFLSLLEASLLMLPLTPQPLTSMCHKATLLTSSSQHTLLSPRLLRLQLVTHVPDPLQPKLTSVCISGLDTTSCGKISLNPLSLLGVEPPCPFLVPFCVAWWLTPQASLSPEFLRPGGGGPEKGTGQTCHFLSLCHRTGTAAPLQDMALTAIYTHYIESLSTWDP